MKKGATHSQKTKQLLRDRIKQLYSTDLSYRRRVSIATKKAMENLDILKKLSIARKGKPRCGDPANWKHTAASKEKLRIAATLQNSQYWKNKVFSKMHKRNLSKSHTGLPSSQKGSKLSQGTKNKIKAARLRQVIPLIDTSIEIKLQNILKANNIIFEKHKQITGQPDIFIEPNICVFADGCYWHRCNQCGYAGIRKKDAEVENTLLKQKYIILRFWEHDINNNLQKCLTTIKKYM